jgi:hypothetical protein
VSRDVQHRRSAADLRAQGTLTTGSIGPITRAPATVRGLPKRLPLPRYRHRRPAENRRSAPGLTCDEEEQARVLQAVAVAVAGTGEMSVYELFSLRDGISDGNWQNEFRNCCTTTTSQNGRMTWFDDLRPAARTCRLMGEPLKHILQRLT